jgi:hypothetical protein
MQAALASNHRVKLGKGESDRRRLLHRASKTRAYQELATRIESFLMKYDNG